MQKRIRNFALFLLAGVLGGVVATGIYSGNDNRSTNREVSNGQVMSTNYEINKVNLPNFDFTEVAPRVTPSVVHIKTRVKRNENEGRRHPFEEFFGDRFDFDEFHQPREGTGSGVIISSRGHIVTNRHVIANASEVEVTLDDNRVYIGEVLGKDPNTDLAVLKIEGDDLQPLRFGNSDDLKVGEWVLAVGNPFNLRSTVTAGIVSAKARNIRLLGGGASIESFIQTDAAVNPGNSGGALTNIKGELVGINTAIATQTGQYAGYSFAIPSSIVRKVTNDIIEFGAVQRGFIGVNIQNVDSEIAKEKGLERISGAYVVGLSEKGAAKGAGIQEGDVIVGVDGRAIESVPHLQEFVSLHSPGDLLEVEIIRNGERITKEVQLLTQDGQKEIAAIGRGDVEEMLGASFEEMDQDELDRYGLEQGVKIAALEQGKLKNAGIPEGFIITRIDNQNVYQVDDIYRIFRDKKGGVLLEGLNPDGSTGYYGFGVEP